MNVRQYVFGEAALGMFVTTGCILYTGALAHIQLTEELLEIN